MQEQKIYIIKELRLEVQGRVVTLEALVHETGLKRVFERSNLPAGLGDLTGQLCQVSFDKMNLQGRFSKEVTPIGTFYNLRFLNISPFEKKRIADEIVKSGLPAPWKRKYARISISTKENDLPMPFLALGKGHLDGIFFNVINFTLGGLLLETPEDDNFEPRLNQEVGFDLVTNTGDRIENMRGMVMHVNEEMHEKGGGRTVTFGMRLMPMTMINEVKYNTLIREFLQGYKKKNQMR